MVSSKGDVELARDVQHIVSTLNSAVRCGRVSAASSPVLFECVFNDLERRVARLRELMIRAGFDPRPVVEADRSLPFVFRKDSPPSET